MLRRPRTCAAAACLAVACGGPGIEVRPAESEGPRFIVQVVDATTSAGSGLSLSTDGEGNPHLAYLSFERPPEAGEPPPPPDPTAPVPPAVMHAHFVDNLWTRSAVADQRTVTPDDATAIAVDAQGVHHVVWTEKSSLLYANNAEGEFSKPEVVSPAAARGPSITVSEDGTVFAAFYELPRNPEGPTALVRVATAGPGAGEDGRGGWTVETAAEAEPTNPSTTAIGATAAGPVVAFGDRSGTTVARRADGDVWRSETADPEGGTGVDMALDADGNPHVSYLTGDGAVRHAHSIDGSPWEVSDVAPGPASGRTAIALDGTGIHHVAWQDGTGIGYANNQEGDFRPEEIRGTDEGTLPALAAGTDDVVYLAWQDADAQELQLATRTEDEPLLAVPSPEATAPAAPGGQAECQPDGADLAIAAPDGAVTSGFDTDCLAVEAATPFTVELTNANGTPHNFSIYTDPGGAEALLDGSANIIQPGSSFTYEGEPIEEPGNFFFRCDLHPTTMTGTFVVAAGPGAAEEGGGGAGGEG